MLIFPENILLPATAVVCMASLGFLSPAVAQEQSEFPGRRVGGGTRGECIVEGRSVVAISPKNNLSLTSRDRPTLYFSVPASESLYQIRFYLHDEEENLVYDTTLMAGEQAQLLGIQLPPAILEPEADYRWSFLTACNPQNPFQSVALEGWIRQVDRDTPAEEPMTKTAALEQVKAYQAAGLWSDAIALSAELLQSHPDCDNYQALWSQLLQDLELDGLLQPDWVISHADRFN